MGKTKQTVRIRLGQKVKIKSDAPIQKLEIKNERSGKTTVVWIGRKNGAQKFFKSEAEARAFVTSS